MLSSNKVMSFVVTPASPSPENAVKSSQTNFHSLEKSGAGRSVPGAAQSREISLTIRPEPGEDIGEPFARMAEALQGATILNLLVFGSATASAAAIEAMPRAFGRVDWPMTWADGGACNGEAIAGIQVSAFVGGAVERIRVDGHVVGSVFEDGGARHCVVGGLGPRQRSLSAEDQTKQTLERLEAALAQGGFSLSDTVRTWFFLDKILSWYEEFNRARTQVYSGIKFRTGSLPASTGVGARNRVGAALTVAARAMRPLTPCAYAEETASPLQCPAPAYGSSFSRAMEIATSRRKHLLISGTASIAPGGETLWRTNVRQQVELAMNVVEAILHSRGFSFHDLTRAVAYFKHIADAQVFTQWCAAHQLSSLPVVLAHCDICRDDLLFELEADADKSIGSF